MGDTQHGEQERTILLKNVQGRGHLGGKGINGRTILKMILDKCEVVSWTELTNNIIQWRAFVNVVMRLRVLKSKPCVEALSSNIMHNGVRDVIKSLDENCQLVLSDTIFSCLCST
jgi:hypothetical protein